MVSRSGGTESGSGEKFFFSLRWKGPGPAFNVGGQAQARSMLEPLFRAGAPRSRPWILFFTSYGRICGAWRGSRTGEGAWQSWAAVFSRGRGKSSERGGYDAPAPVVSPPASRFSLPTWVMTDFNQSRIFNGTCAPFMYIADCTPTARTAYMNASRFWLAANSLALIALLTSLIRRSIRVKERLNTLRLTVICFTLGSPLYGRE